MKGVLNIHELSKSRVPKITRIATPYKRHTLFRAVSISKEEMSKRLPAMEAIWKFTQNILPKMEQRVESRLLSSYLSQYKNPLYKQEIVDAYSQRQLALEKNRLKIPPLKENQVHSQPSGNANNIFNSLEGKGIKYHSAQHIGSYTVFPFERFRELFPNDMFGTYMETEYKYTKSYAIMCREEGVRLANDFSYRTLPKERNLIDYDKLLQECSHDIQASNMKDLIKSEEHFLSFYYDFSLDLIDIYRAYKYTDPLLRQILEAAPIFDGIITILIRELRKNPIKLFLLNKPTRKKIMVDFIEHLKKTVTEQKLVPMTLTEIMIYLRTAMFYLDFNDLRGVISTEDMKKFQDGTEVNNIVKFHLKLKDYHKFCSHLWRPEDLRKYGFNRFKGFNSGALLWGPTGVGKSQILAYLCAWANENDWMVAAVPKGSNIVREGAEVIQHPCGLYLQPKYAQKVLQTLLIANQDRLSGFNIESSLYGKLNLAGYHEKDPPPVVREWDPRRKVWSDYWKTHFSADQLLLMAKAQAKYNLKLTDVLPNPQNLLEIASYGVENALYATVCFGEILEQLYNTDKCNLMIALDDYNEWYDKSIYMSYRHAFNKEYQMRIPPYDLALVRMLMKFDGHLIRNGVKIAATTQTHYFNHICKPDMIHFPTGYAIEIGGLALNDFRNACQYYNMTNWCFKQFKEWEVEAYHMMSQGNWYHFQQSVQNATLLKH